MSSKEPAPAEAATTAEIPSAADKTDAEWRAQLTPEEYRVLRGKGTERAGTGKLNKFYPQPGEGHFACKACGNPLYSCQAKFDSGCGWPAFDKCYTGSVRTEVDETLGMRRIEIMCDACGGHLGHVFEGEGYTATNERHCVNSVSIKFVKGRVPENKDEEAVTASL